MYKNYNRETVLVTGGLGFIGSTIVDELISNGYKVVIFDDMSNGHNMNRYASTIVGDITKKEDFEKITTKINYVIHMAAAISVAESVSNPDKYNRINIQGSENVLEWAVTHNVKKFIAASSAAVYGIPQELPLYEGSPINPISPYAETKYEMEYIMKSFYETYGIECVALRFFNVYGPRQNPNSPYSGVISKFLEKAHEGEAIRINGDGSNTRDFVYVKDIARANVIALKYSKGFKIYNVGTETKVNLKQLAQYIQEVVGSNSVIEYGPAREGDIKDSLSNSSKIKKDLPWKPQVTLEEGLKETYEWYKKSLKSSE